MFLNLFVGNDILAFLFIIIFAAMDFWTVKNVTGRILVNLRWWSEIDEDGQENWIFESDEESNKKQAPTDSFVFWTALYATPCVWAFFAFMDLMSFKFFWMYVCILCFVLSFINLMGYQQCHRDHQDKLRSFIQEKTMGYFLGNAGNVMGSTLGGMKNLIMARMPFFGAR